jgi:Leucine-rich repeat (LRR) protein
MAAHCDLGKRLHCEGHNGTVMYVGPVPPSEGEWLGVEWDDSSRGKHDGTHNGVRYFNCRSGPSSGSFIRRKKAEFGSSFMETFRKRYENSPIEEQVIDGGKVVEFVGMDKLFNKISHFDSLDNVVLSETLLNGAGNEDEIGRTCPNITYLNLNQTLLSSWIEIAKIINQLPQLTSLSLSKNRLTIPPDPSSLMPSFVTITQLKLAKSNLQWDDLCSVLLMMTKLKMLDLSKNNISQLSSKDGTSQCIFPRSLEVLDIEDNQLTDWEDVLILGALPVLKVLWLGGNKLTRVELSAGLFPSLTTLSLKDNRIQSWSDVSHLSQLDHLEHLKLTDNPFMEGETVFNRRQLIIARLPQIGLLNGSTIFEKERVQSERFYIKKYLQQWKQRNSNIDQFKLVHPQYERLVGIYGVPDEEVSSVPSALKNRLINVSIESEGHPSLPKKLPDTMTVQKLKAMIQRLIKIDTTEQILYYKHPRDLNHVVELEDDMKQLSFYSVESDGIVEIKTKL